MRTRIALVAIAPIAVIIIVALVQTATVQPARAAASPPSGATTTTGVIRLVSTAPAHRPARGATGRPSSLLLGLDPALLAHAAGSTPAGSQPPPAGSPSPPPVAAPAGPPADPVTEAERSAWQRVAMCEEGGDWHASSSRFSGGLGITRANWDAYGGRQFAPEAALASEDQQIMVAERIQPTAPDQAGCHGW